MHVNKIDLILIFFDFLLMTDCFLLEIQKGVFVKKCSGMWRKLAIYKIHSKIFFLFPRYQHSYAMMLWTTSNIIDQKIINILKPSYRNVCSQKRQQMINLIS